MFSKDIMCGILLSSAKFVVRVQRNEKMYLGYSVKLSIDIRAKSLSFLKTLERSLLTQNITSLLTEKESKNRDRPLLTIRGTPHIKKTLSLIPELLSNSDDTLNRFRQIQTIVYNNKHKTLEGLEKILIISGEHDGLNRNK
jgi:hypothetical protein